jgi:hypothetical protein
MLIYTYIIMYKRYVVVFIYTLKREVDEEYRAQNNSTALSQFTAHTTNIKVINTTVFVYKTLRLFFDHVKPEATTVTIYKT